LVFWLNRPQSVDKYQTAFVGVCTPNGKSQELLSLTWLVNLQEGRKPCLAYLPSPAGPLAIPSEPGRDRPPRSALGRKFPLAFCPRPQPPCGLLPPTWPLPALPPASRRRADHEALTGRPAAATRGPLPQTSRKWRPPHPNSVIAPAPPRQARLAGPPRSRPASRGSRPRRTSRCSWGSSSSAGSARRRERPSPSFRLPSAGRNKAGQRILFRGLPIAE